MDGLAETNLQIRAGLRAEHRRRAAQARALRPLRLIDSLLDDLEEQHLAGRKRVPETFDARLAELQEICPAARAADLRSRITIVHLLDQLFRIQELLLEAKAGIDDGHADAAEDRLSEAS